MRRLKTWESRALPALIVFLVVCLAYVQAPQTQEFHYDDGHSLVRNPHIRNLENLPDFFKTRSMFGENPEDGMYRPLVLVAHSLNFAVTGLRPGAFVALNIVIHATSAAVIAWALTLLLPMRIGLVAGLLFGLHPVQSEAVHYISARSESLAGLFVALSVGAFALWIAGDRRRQGLRILSLGSFILGLLAKATAIVTPALIFLVAWRAWPDRSGRGALRAAFPWMVISLVYFIFHQLDKTSPLTPLRPVVVQFATQLKAVVHYLISFVMPIRLSVLPQFQESGILEPAVLLSLIALLSLGTVTWRHRQTIPGAAAGLAWFLICLSPTLVVPLNVLINDHRPYLAVAGLIWAAGTVAHHITRSVTIPLLLIAYVLTWQRSDTWETERSLWSDAVVKGPQMAIAHYNLGFAQHIAGQSDSATAHYRMALHIEPDYVRPLNNLGAIMREEGRLVDARKILHRAAELEPDNAEVLNNLGLVATAQGDAQDAVSILLRACDLSPSTGEIWLNLGLAQRDAGDPSAAMRSLQRALQLDPGLRNRVAVTP
ncbi:MAG: tetratricopeptide repeat protein [Candidatus Latescibacterota bacterium]|nr:tetratricopeptide repeat protein [Candidatus Latescibacterota bacterium]